MLDNKPLEWISEWKYLGVVLLSHFTFNCSVEDRLRSFYKCLNAILRVEGRSNDIVMLQLLEEHCVPKLTYAIEVLHIADLNNRRKLRVGYNSIFPQDFQLPLYRIGA